MISVAIHPEVLKDTIAAVLGDKVKSLTVALGEVTLVVSAGDYLASMQLLRDAPGNASARFHGASARMLGVSVSCGADDQRCPDLAQAARLLTPPQSDPRWTTTLEGVRTLQRVVVGCPEG